MNFFSPITNNVFVINNPEVAVAIVKELSGVKDRSIEHKPQEKTENNEISRTIQKTD
jgi:hypothetical protein